MTRTAVTAAFVCLASWAGLALGAGNVGLQRAVAEEPITLLEQPLAIVLSAALAFAVTVALSAARDSARRVLWALIGAILVGDAIGASLIAPAVIGELEIRDALVVFVVLATLGLQPLAAALGATIAGRRTST